MALLADVLQANGGPDMWRQLRKFTVHMSIGGALCARKCSAARLKHIVVDGSTREQSVEIGRPAHDLLSDVEPSYLGVQSPAVVGPGTVNKTWKRIARKRPFASCNVGGGQVFVAIAFSQ